MSATYQAMHLLYNVIINPTKPCTPRNFRQNPHRLAAGDIAFIDKELLLWRTI